VPRLRSALRTFLGGWRNDVAPSWSDLLDDVEPAYAAVDGQLELEEEELIFPGRRGVDLPGAPAGAHIFRALDGSEPSQVRVVVIGQDPYPRLARATGRAFEQGDLTDWRLPAPRPASSLKSIIQCAAHFRTNRQRYLSPKSGWSRLVADLAGGSLALDGPAATFDRWQSQRVLFLNTALTLTRYERGGHPHQLLGHIPLWAPVVGAICRRLATRADTPIVFLSWGSKARQFLAGIGVLQSEAPPAALAPGVRNTAVVDRPHPSVRSFLNRPNVFTETNRQLRRLDTEPIEW